MRARQVAAALVSWSWSPDLTSSSLPSGQSPEQLRSCLIAPQPMQAGMVKSLGCATLSL